MKTRVRTSTPVRTAALAASLLVSAGAAHAQQTFHRSIGLGGSEIAYEVERTRSGGYITVGRTAAASTAPADILVTLYDPCGEVVWDRLIGSVNQQNDVGHSVRQTRDGGYIIAAETDSISPRIGIALIKLSDKGDVVWSNVYSGTPFLDSPSGVAVREAPDGTLVVIGRINGGTSTPTQAVLHRVTAVGVPIFLARYNLNIAGAPPQLSFTDIVLQTNSMVVSGWSMDNANAQMRAFLMGLDINGNPLWADNYVDPVLPTTADALLQSPGMLGFAGRYFTAAGGPQNGLICRTDGVGNLTWARIAPSWRPGFAAADMDGQELVFYGSLTASPESALLKFDPVGNLTVGMRYGTSPNSFVRGHDVVAMPIAPGGGSGYIMTGETNMVLGNGQEDVHLLRTNDLGRSGCRENPFGAVTFPPIQQVQKSVLRSVEQSFQPFPVFSQRPQPGNVIYCVNCCRADFNGDGIVSVQDIYDFLSDWNSQSVGGPIIMKSADINGVNGVTVQDIYDFLALWNLGCP